MDMHHGGDALMPAAVLPTRAAEMQPSLDYAGENATNSSSTPMSRTDAARSFLPAIDGDRADVPGLLHPYTSTTWAPFAIPVAYGAFLLMVALLLVLLWRRASADEPDTLAKEGAANVALAGRAPALAPSLEQLVDPQKPSAPADVPAKPREVGQGATGGACAAACDPLRNAREMCFRNSPAKGAHFEALDGLRAAAFLWVVAHHAALHHVALDAEWRPQFLANLIGWGDAGVTLFLVLSGFLIAHVMLAELRQSDGGTCVHAYGRFLFRRFARIYPSLIFSVLLVQCTVSAVRGYGIFSACDQPLQRLPVFAFIQLSGVWHPLFKHGLLVGNYQKLDACPATAAAWTVSFEAQCYLLFPAVVAFYSPTVIPPWPLRTAATAQPGRTWCPPAVGALVWVLAPAIALSLFAYSMVFRSYETRIVGGRTTFPYLLCEYAAGAIAYFVAGRRLLDWIPSATPRRAGAEHQLVHHRDRMVDGQLHLALQGLWYAALAQQRPQSNRSPNQGRAAKHAPCTSTARVWHALVQVRVAGDDLLGGGHSSGRDGLELRPPDHCGVRRPLRGVRVRLLVRL